MEQPLIVGMAEIKVLRVSAHVEDERNATLTALGLGSCIGVCIYDSVARVAGMAHVVLPESGARGDAPGKYADTALPALLGEMARFGAIRTRMSAAIAGGAQLFTFESRASQPGVGERNAARVAEALRSARVPLLAQDVGGSQGRTLRFCAASGRVTVKKIGEGERELIHLGLVRPVEVRSAA